MEDYKIKPFNRKTKRLRIKNIIITGTLKGIYRVPYVKAIRGALLGFIILVIVFLTIGSYFD